MRLDYVKCKVKHTGEKEPSHKHSQLSLLQRVYCGSACTNISLVLTRDQKAGTYHRQIVNSTEITPCDYINPWGRDAVCSPIHLPQEGYRKLWRKKTSKGMIALRGYERGLSVTHSMEEITPLSETENGRGFRLGKSNSSMLLAVPDLLVAARSRTGRKGSLQALLFLPMVTGFGGPLIWPPEDLLLWYLLSSAISLAAIGVQSNLFSSCRSDWPGLLQQHL